LFLAAARRISPQLVIARKKRWIYNPVILLEQVKVAQPATRNLTSRPALRDQLFSNARAISTSEKGFAYMSAPTVRSDYDQLKNVSQSFSQQADVLNGMNQNLQGNVDVLYDGDWIGQGQQAFIKEWIDEVSPTLKRLQSAMAESARITQQISQIMKEAEENASKCFHI
jgi:WXG100 family type VII secretion target